MENFTIGAYIRWDTKSNPRMTTAKMDHNVISTYYFGGKRRAGSNGIFMMLSLNQVIHQVESTVFTIVKNPWWSSP